MLFCKRNSKEQQRFRTQVEMDLKSFAPVSEKQLASADMGGLEETELAVALSDERVLQTRITYTVLRSPSAVPSFQDCRGWKHR